MSRLWQVVQRSQGDLAMSMEVGHTCMEAWAVHLGWILCWMED